MFILTKGQLGRTNRVSLILDHILLKRPDEDFHKFLRALKTTGQGHIVEKFFTLGGIEGRDRSDDVPRTSQQPIVDDEDSVSHIADWPKFLVRCRNDIVSQLEPGDELLGELLRRGVMNLPVFEVMKVSSEVSFT